eukprot:3008797-Rhodomonas_salina.1
MQKPSAGGVCAGPEIVFGQSDAVESVAGCVCRRLGAEGASTKVAGPSSWREVEEEDGLRTPLALGWGGGNCMG